MAKNDNSLFIKRYKSSYISHSHARGTHGSRKFVCQKNQFILQIERCYSQFQYHYLTSLYEFLSREVEGLAR